MSVKNFKPYNFKCDCGEEFKEYMWVYDGIPQGTKCPTCELLNLPLEITGGSSAMVNVRGGVNGDDWHKGLSGNWKSFLKEFKGRHSKYGNTVNTHSSGLDEI